MDTTLSTSSTNPVQNKVITAEINSIDSMIAAVDAKTEKRLPSQHLTAEGGSLTFTDPSIKENSLIDPCATIPNIAPDTITNTAGSCVVTFSAQDEAFDVCITVRN